MDPISDVIAGLALLVAVGTLLYTRVESTKRQAERVEDRVRTILLDGRRPLERAVSFAELAMPFEPIPAMYAEYQTSGLHELAPRLRRRDDRGTVARIAGTVDTVGAHWSDTKFAYDQWQELWNPGGEGHVQDGPDVEDAFQRFHERRTEFIARGRALLREIEALVADIDQRYR